MSRHCARPGCNHPAVATLSYDYAARTAWLDHLAEDGEPSTHDLCQDHGDRLGVPRGWSLQDRRQMLPRLFGGTAVQPVDAEADDAEDAEPEGGMFTDAAVAS
jgi:hypothetical protein